MEARKTAAHSTTNASALDPNAVYPTNMKMPKRHQNRKKRSSTTPMPKCESLLIVVMPRFLSCALRYGCLKRGGKRFVWTSIRCQRKLKFDSFRDRIRAVAPFRRAFCFYQCWSEHNAGKVPHTSEFILGQFVLQMLSSIRSEPSHLNTI
jgi:hypothetical protein